MNQVYRLTIGSVAVISSSIVYANEKFIGRFTTVTESACNQQIVLASGGEGEYLQTCRREDGSGIDDEERQSITWSSNGNTISVIMAGGIRYFEYRNSIPCSSFGSNGETDGLVAKKNRFWRAPITCN